MHNAVPSAPAHPSSACRHLLPQGAKKAVARVSPTVAVAKEARRRRSFFSPCGRRCRQADEGDPRANWLGLAAFLAASFAAPAHAADLTAITPTRVIYPGETISTDSLDEVRLRSNRPPTSPVATDVAQVSGKVAKRTLVPGKLIPLAVLREAYLVEQGKPVEAIYSLNNLSISLTAVPLQSGAVGDFVRLRNPDSGKVFSGTVLADGTVAVGGS